MFKVGLTGGIASGKTTVAKGLSQRGAILIDYDTLARAVVAPGTAAFSDVVQRFGPAIVAADGGLDRTKLSEIIFDDTAAREALNAIVHPWVRATAAQIERNIDDPYAIVVHDIPLLIESGLAQTFDTVVVVDINPDIQLARLMHRNGLNRDAALARIASQASRQERLQQANFVINNSGSETALQLLINELWKALQHDQHSDRFTW